MISAKFEDFSFVRENVSYWFDTLKGKDSILLIYLLFLSNLIVEVPELRTFILCTVEKNSGLHLCK